MSEESACLLLGYLFDGRLLPGNTKRPSSMENAQCYNPGSLSGFNTRFAPLGGPLPQQGNPTAS